MSGNKSHIHRATKRVSRNHGSDKIDMIQSALIESGFNTIQEPTIQNEIFSTNNKIRNPDLKITFGGMTIYLESDGKVHGTLEQPTEATVSRIKDFLNAKLECVLINHETIHELRQILKVNASIEDLTRFLSVYIILEQYSKHLARSKL